MSPAPHCDTRLGGVSARGVCPCPPGVVTGSVPPTESPGPPGQLLVSPGVAVSGWGHKGVVWGHLCSRHPFPAGWPQAAVLGVPLWGQELGPRHRVWVWAVSPGLCPPPLQSHPQDGAGGHGVFGGWGSGLGGGCGGAGAGFRGGMEGSGVWPWGHLGALAQDQGWVWGFGLWDLLWGLSYGVCQHLP